MANRHESHCNHDLAVCKHCDVAYCRKCNREWSAACHLVHYPNWYTTSVPWTTNNVFGNSQFTAPTGTAAVAPLSTVTINDAEWNKDAQQLHVHST